jgi:hypothetical protein
MRDGFMFAFWTIIGFSVLGGAVIGIGTPFVFKGVKYLFSGDTRVLEDRISTLEKVIEELSKRGAKD